MALATAILFLPVAYASLVELLSKPKPIDLEWWLSEAAEAEVVAARQVENEGIYLCCSCPMSASRGPTSCPGTARSAEQLQQALREAQQKGSGVQMRLPLSPRSTTASPSSTRCRSRPCRPRT